MNVANWNTESRDQYTEKQPAPTHYEAPAGADGGTYDSVANILTEEGANLHTQTKLLLRPISNLESHLYMCSPPL